MQTGDWLRISAILAVALGLRLWAFDWGLPNPLRSQSLHPDEPFGVSAMLQMTTDPLMHRPGNKFAFVKGCGYFNSGMAVIVAAKALGAIHLDQQNQPSDLTNLRRCYLAARMVSLLFSLGTVVLIFLSARLLFGPRVAEIAAAIEAISPLPVINAHWATPDCAQAFWILLCLYLAGRSIRDRRWLAAAGLVAGMAGAFKYPGLSALLIVWAAALLFQPQERSRRLVLALLSLPLAAAGFLLFSPAVLVEPAGFAQGLALDNSLVNQSYVDLAGNVLRYPTYLVKTTGLILPLWALAAILYSLVRPRRETWLILAWLLPYIAIMTSSWFIVTRYAVPWMAVLSLLMARMAVELIDLSQPRRKFWTSAGFALAGLLILGVTLLHLRTMTRTDPRDLAAQWIPDHIPPGAAVAITLSHAGDESFVVPVDRKQYQVLPLFFRPDIDASTYLDRPFLYLATNERAWAEGAQPRHPSQALFWRQVMDSNHWELLVRFANRPSWPGLLLRDPLPEDLYYLYQETRIYKRYP